MNVLASTSNLIAPLLIDSNIGIVPTSVSPLGVEFGLDGTVEHSSTVLINVPGVADGGLLGDQKHFVKSEAAAGLMELERMTSVGMESYIGSPLSVFNRDSSSFAADLKKRPVALNEASYARLRLPAYLRMLSDNPNKETMAGDSLMKIAPESGKLIGLKSLIAKATTYDLAATLYTCAGASEKAKNAHAHAANSFSDMAIFLAESKIVPNVSDDGEIVARPFDSFGYSTAVFYGIYHSYWAGDISILTNMANFACDMLRAKDAKKSGAFALRSAAWIEMFSEDSSYNKIARAELLAKGLPALKPIEIKDRNGGVKVRRSSISDSRHPFSQAAFGLLGWHQYAQLCALKDMLLDEGTKEISRKALDELRIAERVTGDAQRAAGKIISDSILAGASSVDRLSAEEMKLNEEDIIKAVDAIEKAITLLTNNTAGIQIRQAARANIARFYLIAIQQKVNALEAKDLEAAKHWDVLAQRLEKKINRII